MSELISRVENSLSSASLEESLRQVRLLSLFESGTELVAFYRRLLRKADSELTGEILERMAAMDVSATLDWLKSARAAEDHQLFSNAQEAMKRPVLLHILFTCLDETESYDSSDAKQILDVLPPYVSTAMLFFVLRRLYKADQTEFRTIRVLFDAIPRNEILAGMEKLRSCGDPEFLMSAVLYLKSVNEPKRAVQFLECFSQLEYGAGMTTALKQLDHDLRFRKRPAGEKLIAVITDSAVVARAFIRSSEGIATVEHINESVKSVLHNQISALTPELLVVDKSALKGEALEFSIDLIRSGYRQPFLFAADFLSAHQKEQLVAAGIRDFMQIPFTIDEAADRIHQILEQVEKEAVVNKAKQSLPAGAILCREGDPGDCCFVIQKGKVKIWRRDNSGREILLATLGAGEIFGEMSIIDKSPRSATVSVVEECELLRIAEENFEKVLSGNPPFALKMIRILVTRLRGVTERLKELESKH